MSTVNDSGTHFNFQNYRGFLKFSQWTLRILYISTVIILYTDNLFISKANYETEKLFSVLISEIYIKCFYAFLGFKTLWWLWQTWISFKFRSIWKNRPQRRLVLSATYWFYEIIKYFQFTDLQCTRCSMNSNYFFF